MEQDDENRNRANLAAAMFLLGLIAVAIWTLNSFLSQERLQRCLDQRRSDCYAIEAPPREGLRQPTR